MCVCDVDERCGVGFAWVIAVASTEHEHKLQTELDSLRQNNDINLLRRSLEITKSLLKQSTEAYHLHLMSFQERLGRADAVITSLQGMRGLSDRRQRVM